MRPGRRSYIVVDASVSLKWVLDDEDCVDSATALRDDGLRGRFRMVVPSLWHYEITNGVLVAVRRGRLPSTEGAQAVSSLLDLGLQSIDLKMDGCYQIADRYKVATYDAAYLTLSAALDAEFWTGDNRLYRAVSSTLPFVRWIGDYRPLRLFAVRNPPDRPAQSLQ